MSPVFESIARFGAAILINGLWQGALIAGVTALALRCFPKANASTRYAAWSLALVALFVVPIVTSLTRITVTPAATTTVQSVGTNATHAQTKPSAERTATVPTAVGRTASTIPHAPAPWRLSFALPNMLATILFALWAVVAIVVVIRLLVALLQLERLKNDALPLAVDYRDTMTRWQSAGKGERDVRICVSDEIEVPVAIGLFDAMILLPKQLVDSLDASEIDQICLHELAHLLRNDDWSNGLQRLLMALMIYNPAAWFIGRQMDVEREVACDDFVLELTGAAKPYAFCLTKMAEMTSWPHAPLPAPGVFVTRKNISIRIERLLRSGRAIGRGITPSAASAVVAGLVAVIAVLRTVTPSIAFTLPSMPATIAPPPTPAPIVAHAKPSPPHVTPQMAGRTISVQIPEQHVHVPAVTVPEQTIDLKARTISVHVPAIVHVPAPISATLVANGGRDCTGCNFNGARLEHHDFRNQSLSGSNFDDADLRGSNFDGAQLEGVNFNRADLRDVSFRNASLDGCSMANARLDGVDFTGARLTGCNIDVSKLQPAQVRNVLSNCSGCNYARANLHGLDLHGIRLEGENMDGADLGNTNLSGVVFTGVNLARASLRGAKLDGATFEGCNFDGADLRGVDLSRATIEGSSLDRAIMR